MFKIKKVILFLILISPLLFVLFVGYPINKNTRQGALNYSARCFRVGEFNEFLNCSKNHAALKGKGLVSSINNETASLYSGFNIVLFVAFAVQILLVFAVI